MCIYVLLNKYVYIILYYIILYYVYLYVDLCCIFSIKSLCIVNENDCGICQFPVFCFRGYLGT